MSFQARLPGNRSRKYNRPIHKGCDKLYRNAISIISVRYIVCVFRLFWQQLMWLSLRTH